MIKSIIRMFWMNLCLQMKSKILLYSMHKTWSYIIFPCINNLILLIFFGGVRGGRGGGYHIFGPKLFCRVFVFRRVMFIVICDLLLYLQIKGLKLSWIYPVFNSIPVLKNGIRNTVFYPVASQKPVYFFKVRWMDMRSRR